MYLQYGIQVVTRQLSSSPNTESGALVSLILAFLMLATSVLFEALAAKAYFHHHARRFLSDYGMPISLIACSGVAYWGRFNAANPATLPVGGAFKAAQGREWLVRFWELDGKWVGIACPFGIILWILFFFDHNVSVRRLEALLLSSVLSLHHRSRLWHRDPSSHCGSLLASITTSSFWE